MPKRKRKVSKNVRGKIITLLDEKPRSVSELAILIYGKDNRRTRMRVKSVLYHLRGVVEIDDNWVCYLVF